MPQGHRAAEHQLGARGSSTGASSSSFSSRSGDEARAAALGRVIDLTFTFLRTGKPRLGDPGREKGRKMGQQHAGRAAPRLIKASSAHIGRTCPGEDATGREIRGRSEAMGARATRRPPSSARGRAVGKTGHGPSLRGGRTSAGPSAATPPQPQLGYFRHSRPKKQLHFDSSVRGWFFFFLCRESLQHGNPE